MSDLTSEDSQPSPKYGNPSIDGQIGVGHCLVDTQSGLLVGYDLAVKGWLTEPRSSVEGATLYDLFPELSELPPETSLEPGGTIVRHLNLQSGGNCQGASRVGFTRFESSWGNLVLVTIRLVDAESATEVSFDALTGLPNRSQLAKERESWFRRNPQTLVPHAILFIDLDDFKQVNDRMGHLIGDSVLVTIAQRWQKCLRDGDLVVRYGGDEFVVLLKDVENKDQIPLIVDRLTLAACKPIAIDGIEVVVGASIGIAFCPDYKLSLEELILKADRDMYETKRSRKQSQS